MRFTGEVFRDYDAYADAWLSYIARDWSCALSGKKNLTFEEAAISEKLLKAQADQFPPSHVELLCRTVSQPVASSKTPPCKTSKKPRS